MSVQNEKISIPDRQPRTLLPEEFSIKDWATLEPYLEELKNRPIQSGAELEKWLPDRSELERVFA